MPIAAGPHAEDTYREIYYVEQTGVGYLHFDFYNGAMSTEQCHRLRDAYAYARSRGETRVIVLMGGSDYFSNGIHLNVIEAADDPAAESWRNLNAIDDLVRDIVETDTHLVISALGGDAGAGGVPLALAADYVIAREDAVLNPYYQHMGGLYGSEYWTYLLPRRVGPVTTARLTGPPFRPVGTAEAIRTGLLDAAFEADLDEFWVLTARLGERIANDGLYQARLRDKRHRRALDERVKPLQAYRDEELTRCHECLFGPDRAHHEARRRFVYKLGEVGADTPAPIPPRARPGGPLPTRSSVERPHLDLVSQPVFHHRREGNGETLRSPPRAGEPPRRLKSPSEHGLPGTHGPARYSVRERVGVPATSRPTDPSQQSVLDAAATDTGNRPVNATNPQQTRHKEDGWN